jgi:hypothetical protein
MGRRGKSSFLFVVHECVDEHVEQRNIYLGFKIALVDFHAYYYCLCVMSIFSGFRLEKCKAKGE